ncbi:MAG: hypothetical protein K0R78_1618 [Pelosinus sp.]|jgi:hypothetical protein|nr:hypothetical protein [Pelosinus sp.]
MIFLSRHIIAYVNRSGSIECDAQNPMLLENGFDFIDTVQDIAYEKFSR